MPSRSYRALAWAGDNETAQSGQETVAEAGAANGIEEAVNVVTDDGASDLELASEHALAAVGAGADTGQPDPGSQNTEMAEPEPIVTPLDVVQVARAWEEDVLQVSFAVMLDDDPATATPSGLIVSQQIPDGWDVVEAEPLVEMVDEENRLVKWLFLGSAVTNSSIYSLSMRAPAEQVGNWSETLAWYTYRQPDGQCVDVEVIPYPESDIQPGN
jgi:hypothetical protein